MSERWFFDTSVLVAALVREHPHHAAAAPLLNLAFSQRRTAAISAHCLAELYSVLTRAPQPLLIHPEEAWMMIEQSLLTHVEIISLDADEYRDVVKTCAGRAWAGGKVYDLLHIRAAEKWRCTRLYTFNVKHFRLMASPGIADKITAP